MSTRLLHTPRATDETSCISFPFRQAERRVVALWANLSQPPQRKFCSGQSDESSLVSPRVGDKRRGPLRGLTGPRSMEVRA